MGRWRLVGMVSLAIGAHAALNMRALDAAKAISAEQSADAANQPVADRAGDRQRPLSRRQRAADPADQRRPRLTAALRRNGFDVDVIEDANKDDMVRAVGRLKARVKPDSVVMLFFGGYGIQAGRESYMIPVDAAIWKDGDVRSKGVSSNPCST